MSGVPVVLVLDRQALFTAAIGRLLTAPPLGATVIGVNSLADALETLASHEVDVLVCDPAAHRAGWPELLHVVHQRKSGLPVVLLVDPTDETMLGALLVGAAGVFSKAAEASELIEGLQAVMRGESVLDPTLLARLIFAVGDHLQAGSPGAGTLSTSEAEVLDLLAAGLSIREIASRTRATQRTVRIQMAAVYRKLRLHSQAASHGPGERARVQHRPMKMLRRHPILG